MSDENQQSRASALMAMLPQAKVHVFSAEEHTQDIIASLSGDWRFGRVTLEVKGNAIDDAIAQYAAGEGSPNVVVIQTADTGDDFRAKLAALAENCDEGTAALVIGPVNDVQLYRALTGIGVSDYLVHPVSLYDMAEALSRALLSLLGATGSRLIAVVGAKGGVGTTNIAHLVATASADRLNQKTVLLDAAAGHSILGSQFGVNPTGTLVEAAKAAIDRDHDTLSRILMAISENLTFLNTGAEPILGNASQQKLFEMLLERMLGQYPVVVADLSSASPAIQASVVARAHGIMFVASPTVTSLSLTRTLIKEVQGMRGNDTTNLNLIINRRGEMPAFEVLDRDISDAVGLDIAATIPYMPRHFLKSESEGMRPSENAEGARAMDALMPLMQNLLGIEAITETHEKHSILPDLLKKLRG